MSSKSHPESHRESIYQIISSDFQQSGYPCTQVLRMKKNEYSVGLLHIESNKELVGATADKFTAKL